MTIYKNTLPKYLLLSFLIAFTLSGCKEVELNEDPDWAYSGTQAISDAKSMKMEIWFYKNTNWVRLYYTFIEDQITRGETLKYTKEGNYLLFTEFQTDNPIMHGTLIEDNCISITLEGSLGEVWDSYNKSYQIKTTMVLSPMADYYGRILLPQWN